MSINAISKLILNTLGLYVLLVLLNACNAVQESRDEPIITPLNLDLPEDNLKAFAKIRASLDSTEECVYKWTGTAYSIIDGVRSKTLFALEGYNIARLVPIEGGYQLLTKEFMAYKDPNSGKIIDTWANPFTKDTLEVLPVQNDPVNAKFLLAGGRGGEWGLPYETLGKKRFCMYIDVLLLYPSPLSVVDYPEYSQSAMYQAGELFQFFADLEEVSNPEVKSANVEISWTRIGPWLPWMKMGQRQGQMLYQCRGYKTSNGLNALSPELLKLVTEKYPAYLHTPTTYTKPNETSWTYFKKWLEEHKEK